MKIKLLIILTVLLISTVYPAIAEESNGDQVTVTIDDETYVLVNTGGGGVKEYPRQHISSHPDTMHPYYGPLKPKHHQWTPLRGDRVVHPEMLKPYSQVKQWWKKIKWTRSYSMPERSGQMHRLPGKPVDPNDISIFTLELPSPDGGIPLHTELILLSLAWPNTHSFRFYSEIYLNSEPTAKGISVGSGGSFSKALDNSEGYAFAVNPLMGVAWTQLKVPYTVRVTFYNDGDVWLYNPTKSSIAQTATRRMKKNGDKPVPPEPISWIFFDTNKYRIRQDQLPNVNRVVNYITTYWAELIRMRHAIIFDGHCDIRYDMKYNDYLGMERAKAIRNKVKEILAAKGYPKQTLNKMLLYKSSGWRVSSNKLNHDDRRVEVFRAKPLSIKPEKGNTAS